MHKFSEDLFRNAIDLNDTVVFEYNRTKDSIVFSDNIDKYIPTATSLERFISDMHKRGKIFEADIEKAISFFTVEPEEDKVKMDYIRILDINGEYFWYQIKGRNVKKSSENTENTEENTDLSGEDVFYGTIAYIDDDIKHRDDEYSKNRDNLTHLLTRDSFLADVDEYMFDPPKEVMPAMLVVDIDDFEDWTAINGNIGGDGVLIEISRILKRAFRGTDIIGYLGNDRFAVFMKGVRSINILVERASYVKDTVKNVWEDLSQKSRLTVSVGIAYVRSGEIGAEGLYDRSLAALKIAKNQGKDNFILFNESMEIVVDCPDPILSTKEMELVRNILDPMLTWAYAVDEDYNLLYRNEILEDRLNNTCGGKCFETNKGYSSPCEDCPIKSIDSRMDTADAEVYSPSLRTTCHIHTTKITLRNNKNIYILASTKEDTVRQQEVLSESQNRIRDSLLTMMDVIWDVDITRNTCIRMKEKNIRSIMDMRICNYQRLVDYYAQNVIHSEDLSAFLETTDVRYLKQYKKQGYQVLCREVRMLKVSGEYEWYNIYTVFMEDEKRVLIICLNVNEYKRHRMEETQAKIKYEIMRQKNDILKEMALSNERHENVNEMIGMLVYEYTVADSSYYLCPMFEDVFNISVKELKNEWSLLDMLKCYPDDEETFERFREELMTSGRRCKATVRLFNKNGVAVWYSIVVEALRGLNNIPVRYLGTLQNVDSEMKIKMEMEYRANYDSVTGLYNPDTFYRKVAEKIHLVEDANMAIISIDIDRFSLINDRFGIEMGNVTLRIMGRAIKNVIPRNGYAGRYQGDMFSMLVCYSDEEELLSLMNDLSAEMRDNSELPTPVSLYYGIYVITDPDVPVRLMCDRARAIARQVKGSAITNYAVYDDAIRLKLREQQEIENEMYAALENHEFEMFLQPQIDIRTGKLIGAEALVRWRHPTKGLLSPAQFLPLFENNGFIVKLDVYMWNEAAKYISELNERNIELPISVNVSRLHIGTSDVLQMITDIVDKYNVDHRLFEVEITENLFVDDITDLFNEMDNLKSRGFRILMDDFGSGYSSLNMLRKAPIDVMKIDRFFLDEIMSTERGKIIVESSVRMAKQLGLGVIAEGVETKEQLDFLKSIDCDTAQGYYYSKPIPVSEFEVFMKKYL